MRLLVTGGAGYLGSEVARQAVAAGHDVLATQLEHAPPHGGAVRLDLRDADAVQRALLEHGPDVVVHTAYRQADAFLDGDVVHASRNVALAAHRTAARLIHLSTDLVFDGEQGAPYREGDEPRPVSAYGRAKLEAEKLVAELHPEALVVRTSLLYGKAELGPQERLAGTFDAMFYIDEIRCPTIVGELAAALLELALRDEKGVLHVAAPDAVSRLELARLLGCAAPRGAPAPPGRARNVALDSSEAAKLLHTPLRGIRENRP
jgi:dTDP-4-dehydrorhamnose reductase